MNARGRAGTQSSGLLIRGFEVQVPGGEIPLAHPAGTPAVGAAGCLADRPGYERAQLPLDEVADYWERGP
jgi:hypothetical protein